MRDRLIPSVTIVIVLSLGLGLACEEESADLSPRPDAQAPTTGGSDALGPLSDGTVFEPREGGVGMLGRQPVLERVPGSPSNVSALVRLGGLLLFVAEDDEHGEELWRSDGTAAGTVLLKDIRAGSVGSSPDSFAVMNGVLYFAATDSSSGKELWRSNGTGDGTTRVRDVIPGTESSFAAQLTVAGDTLYFVARDTRNVGPKLWKSDGSESGTVPVPYTNAADDGTPTLRGSHAGWLLYENHRTNLPRQLWRSDGTSVGTFALATGNSALAFSEIVSFGAVAYFDGDTTAEGKEVWRTDGTLAGTRLVKDIVPGTGNANPGGFAALGNVVFFAARNDATGIELWKTDGTAEGTSQVVDLFVGVDSARPSFLTAFAGRMFFAANSTLGPQLFSTDGTQVGTHSLSIGPEAGPWTPKQLTVLGESLYFAGSDGEGEETVWRTDGTQTGTQSVLSTTGDFVRDARLFLAFGGTVYLVGDDGAGDALWRVVER